MNAGEVRAIVLESMHATAPDAELADLSPDADFRSALDVDSYDVLQILLAIHRRLGVEVPDAVAGELTTLNQIVDYVLPRLPSTAAGADSPADPAERSHG